MKALKDIAGMVGSGMQNAVVNRKVAMDYASKIRSAGQIPDAQFNTHYKTMLDMLKRGDSEGATKYMQEHREIADKQTQTMMNQRKQSMPEKKMMVNGKMMSSDEVQKTIRGKRK